MRGRDGMAMPNRTAIVLLMLGVTCFAASSAIAPHGGALGARALLPRSRSKLSTPQTGDQHSVLRLRGGIFGIGRRSSQDLTEALGNASAALSPELVNPAYGKQQDSAEAEEVRPQFNDPRGCMHSFHADFPHRKIAPTSWHPAKGTGKEFMTPISPFVTADFTKENMS